MAMLRAALGAVALMVLAAGASAAEDYPTRTVKIIAPFGPGGPADLYVRVVAQELQKALHQTFVVENRPGAGTTIGTEVAAKAPPDGYTLLLVSGTQTVNETLYPKKSYQLMRDLVPVAPLVDTDLVLVVHPSVPAKSVAELIALAKQKPGTLNYGSSGPGSNYHMAGELLKNLTSIDIVHVPYKGSTGARNDIISGNIQILFDAVPTMTQMIESGRVRAIGTSGQTRSSNLPNVPTVAETVPGFSATLWVGLMAPAGTPQPVVDKLNGEISKILSRQGVRDSWGQQGAVPLIMTQAKFKTFMEGQIATWAKVVKDNHIALIQ
jgi:tripartite-type tricarboxylate transporter receptor subunit TctC